MRSRKTDFPSSGQGASLKHWTFAFRAIFVLFILWASATTIVATSRPAAHDGHSPHVLIVLAIGEVLGALLFLVAAAQVVGLVLLLFIFAIAAVEATLFGENPLRFLYFAATALFIYAVDRRIKKEATAAPD